MFQGGTVTRSNSIIIYNKIKVSFLKLLIY